MKIFEINITENVICFLKNILKNKELLTINQLIKESCGILDFFNNQKEILEIFQILNNEQYLISESDRAEYGDFQTPKNLCDRVCRLLKSKNIKPQILIEPTCGKGNFILSALKSFPTLEKIIGIEIYPKYVWETKFSILDYFIANSLKHIPEIKIINEDIFVFNFKETVIQHQGKELLIIGNPPWVTNSKLSSLNSSNLPNKSNLKNHNGLDAITGKGNFDIAESIVLMFLNNYSQHNGHFAFLQKNSVTKNILFDQLRNKYSIANIEKYNFNAKIEFNVSTDASLLFFRLNQEYSTMCNEYDLYEPEKLINKLGWFNNKFVSKLSTYSELYDYDGTCPIVWRQGLKHDCSKIMELERINNCFINSFNEKIDIENDLVYGILKSSDLKTFV